MSNRAELLALAEWINNSVDTLNRTRRTLGFNRDDQVHLAMLVHRHSGQIVSALRAASAPAAGGEALIFWYRNYRGEEGYRRVIPISFRFGVSEWHGDKPQWLMFGLDTEKNVEREFAMSDMKNFVGTVAPISVYSTPPSDASGAVREALEQARNRIHYLGVAHSESRHYIANEQIYLPKIDAALSALPSQADVGRTAPAMDVRETIAEMQSVAAGDYEGYEETLDPWTSDNRATIDRWLGTLSASPPEMDEPGTCMACGVALVEGDEVYNEKEGGIIHAACCGPEREGYFIDDDQPLGPDDPIPTPWKWSSLTPPPSVTGAEAAAGESADRTGAEYGMPWLTEDEMP